MRFSLRTLILVMLLGGPALAVMWWWPFFGVLVGSLLLALGVITGALLLHHWLITRMQTRMALGQSSARAAGWEMSVLMAFVATSAGLIGAWVEYIVPRFLK